VASRKKSALAAIPGMDSSSSREAWYAQKKRWSGIMQQQQAREMPAYADIEEVRTVTGASACNQLLAEGWVLLGVYPVTRIGEMTEGQPKDEQERKRIEDTQRYVRRLVGYVVGKEESKLSQK
jgi:hypothetical protein